ncbi:hypothetical protein G6F37_003597 [Rhizopus arrhizus]|nr:hypothetical protein G6F38_005224 [Rhizopus arrhizus]KAG1160867.1 hypothetical protein G6F37_003597 [Rhizopus arrhizus]
MLSPNKRLKLSTDQLTAPVTHTIQPDDDDSAMFDDDIALDEIDLSALLTHPKGPEPSDSDIFDDIPQEAFEQILDPPTTPTSTTSTLVTDNEGSDRLSRASSGSTMVANETELKERPKSRKKFTRYLVANMTIERYQKRDVELTEKVLTLLQEDENTAMTVRLRDEWFQTTVAVGNVVHIPLTPNRTEITVDQQENFIIVHPDRLISCTAVADSYQCLRRSVLQTKVRAIGEYTESLVHGNILHRVLQNALQTGDFSVRSIQQAMREVIEASLEELYGIDQDEQTAMEVLGEYADSIHQFGSVFVGSMPKPRARVSSDMGPDAAKEMGCDTVAISRVLDIEEHLWSPTYGLKGMIDASVQLKLSPTNRVLTVPFELKTGRTSRFLSNRAQTILYTLLMSDRYDIDIGAGILYYSKTNSLYLVPAVRSELVSILIARNTLASSLNAQERIPEMIKNFHSCQYCYVTDVCTLYHKSIEGGTDVTSGLYKLFEEKTGHMTSKMANFFKHWWELLDKEETDIDYIRKSIWSQSAQEREMSGRCLSDLKLSLADSSIQPEISQWKYCFVRADAERPLFSNLSVGDPVVVSSMEGHINLAMGHVSRLSSEEILLSLNEPLRHPPTRSADFDLNDNQTFNTLIRHKADMEQFYKDDKVRYRIDKDEIATGMATLRNNLVMLMANTGDSRNRRLRELVVHLERPVFDSSILPQQPINPQLNPDQRKVLTRVLQTKDYNLILGMPGTGKTTTTAEIIKYLVGMNKTILVAAFTHTALDNVLSKVRDQGMDVLRLGNVDKVMESMRDCVPVFKKGLTTVEEMKAFYDSKKVVGITCLGIGHSLIQKRHFDYCIIDEASQITLPMCLGPIRFADRFILVGDLYQLPPIVRNGEASEKGLDKSLFAILAEAHPESVSRLEYQYRMNKEIMQVANTVVYDGKLKCGSHLIATRSLSLPRLESGLRSLHENQPCSMTDCWIRQVLDPEQKVVFVNTDLLPASETRAFGSFLHNEKEGRLVSQITTALLACGVEEEQLAVVSVYRSQLRTISQFLKTRRKIEIATIDKYQGRDKDCVIISLVRNNAQGNCGDLLRDWRRLNVAITRAKSKLVLIGSVNTLRVSSPYCQLLDLLEKKGWIQTLLKDAHETHHFSDKTTIVKKKEHKTFRSNLSRKNEMCISEETI